jgi:hypothetical protein
MTEDGASVDSVAGELATRLGAVGGYAGEAMRRGVRDAAGGAQTIARLVQADAGAAQHIESADIAAPAAPGPAEPSAVGERRRPETETPPPGGERLRAGEKATETGVADHHSGSGDRPAADVPPAPTATERVVGDRPVPDPAAAIGHHTPWTPAGAEQASGHTPGSTPWNSGAGSPMPYPPGMPGGLGSLTPQERPPRGSAPWSRGRGSQEETVFPRPRPDRSNSTNRTEWAPP